MSSGGAAESKLLQDAQVPTAPLHTWSSKLCLGYAVVALCLMPLCLRFGGVSPRWEKPDPEEVWHARSGILLVFSAFMSEMFLLISQTAHVRILKRSDADLCPYRLGDSVLTLSSYTTKALAALYLGWCNGGIVHQDTLAVNGPRPVYFGRFVQWSIAVPLLIVLGNRPCMDRLSSHEKLHRCAPSVAASFLYCWAAWVMEVTTHSQIRWLMCATSFSGVLVVMIDQFALFHQHRSEPLGSYKVGMLIYSNVVFAFYGVCFMMSRFGMISSLSEQMFYAYADATLKVLQGSLLSMVRSRQDFDLLHRCWTAALAANQDLYNLIEKAKAPVFALDMSCCVVHWNNNLESLTGWSFADIKGRQLLDVVADECKDDVKAALDKMLEAAKGQARSPQEDVPHSLVEIVIPVKGSGDRLRQLAMSLVPKATMDGGCAGLMAIGQDLSEIAELKLVQDRRSALMAMLSHEIRSPLHGMTGLTAALLDTQAGKSIGRQLSMVRNCSMRLLDLVTNVMDMAQHEKRKKAGRGPTQPMVPVDFHAIADEVFVMMTSAVDKANNPLVRKSVRMVNEIEGQRVPLVMGNPYQCTQLIYNLTTNACKFTDTGSVTLSAEYSEAESCLKISVTDTGRGISPEGQKRIFQPFEQECTGDARSFQGIGLGLAVCSEIAELHGGKLEVDSQLGKGSKFTFSLFADGSLGWTELPSERQDLTPAAPEPPLALADPKVFAGRPKVLSVDDCEVNQEVIQNALKDLYDVQIAMDGKQALDILRRGKRNKEALPDVVLLDVQMPGMTGFEVCEEIRSTVEDTHIRMFIIMVSARTPQDLSAIEGYAKGSTDYLAKPFNVQVLRRKVAVAVKMKREATFCKDVIKDYGAPVKVITQETMKNAEEKISKMQLELEKAVQERDQLEAKTAELMRKMSTERSVVRRGRPEEAPSVSSWAEEASGELMQAKGTFRAVGVQLDVLSKLTEGCQDLLTFGQRTATTMDTLPTAGFSEEQEECGSDKPTTRSLSDYRHPAVRHGWISGVATHLDMMSVVAKKARGMVSIQDEQLRPHSVR